MLNTTYQNSAHILKHLVFWRCTPVALLRYELTGLRIHIPDKIQIVDGHLIVFILFGWTWWFDLKSAKRHLKF